MTDRRTVDARTCPDCNGEGEIDGKQCLRCEGVGKLDDGEEQENGNALNDRPPFGAGDTDQSTPQQIRRRHVRRHIQLPDGRMLIPRAEFATDILGEDERTTRRRHLPTLYIAGVSYVDRDRSLNIVAEGVERPNQPAPTTPKPRVRVLARHDRIKHKPKPSDGGKTP